MKMETKESYWIEATLPAEVATVSQQVSMADLLGSTVTDGTYVKKNCFQKLQASIPARYILTFMGFWGFFMAYTVRVNLNVAIVAMVNWTQSESSNASTTEECPVETTMLNSPSRNMEGEFYWDANLQGFILGSFFYGYVVTPIPGGIMAEKFGTKWLFCISNLVPVILGLLSPPAVRWSVTAFIVIRVIQGLGQGLLYPVMNAMLARWIPKQEITLVSTIIYSGTLFGTVLSMVVTGILCDSDVFGGWPASFYIFALCGLVWCLLWTLLVYDTPATHPRITEEELLYIKSSLDSEESKQKYSLPWCALLKSIPLWAVIITHFGHVWGFYVLCTQFPTYQKTVLHFTNTENGLYAGLPYLCQGICGWITSYLANVIRRKGYVSTGKVRKWANTISQFVPALCLLGITLVKCDRTWNVVLVTIAMGVNGMVYSGFMLSHMDMAPKYAGTLMGLTNTIANLAGFLAPYVVGYLVRDGGTLQQWSTAFYITMGMYIVPALMFHIWGSTELQPWA